MKIKLLAALALSLGLTSAFAGSATANLNVTLNVNGTCSFDNPVYSATITTVPGSLAAQNVAIGYHCAAGLNPTLSSVDQSTSLTNETLTAQFLYEPVANGVPQPVNGVALDPALTVFNGVVAVASTSASGNPETLGQFVFSIPLTINY